MRTGRRVLLGFLALTILLSWPLARHAANAVVVGGPDTDLFLWTLGWNTHALTHGIFSIFDANIVYPQRLTLAYSENLIGDMIFAAPVIWLTGDTVLALNVVSIASCVFCGAGAYFLARSVGVSRPGAVLAGIVFAFSPPRFLRISQLHLTSVHWIPFTLGCLHNYFEKGRPRDLKLAVGFFTLQALSSGYGAAFNTISVAAFLVFRLLTGEPPAFARRIRDLGVTGALLLVPAVLSVLPYLVVQREMNFRRSLENWAVPASTFLATPSHLDASVLSLASLEWVNHDAAAWLFPGYVPIVLALLAFLPVWHLSKTTGVTRERLFGWLAAFSVLVAVLALIMFAATIIAGPFRWRIGSTTILSVREPLRILMIAAVAVLVRASLLRSVPFNPMARVAAWRERAGRWGERLRADPRAFYVLLTLITVLLSIGPPFSLWPKVYWLPVFNLIRVPSRFTILGMLGLAVLAALGFDRWLGARPARRSEIAAWFVGAVMVAEFAVIPLGLVPYRVDIPEIDRWLDSRPKPFAIAEVPIPPFGAGGAWERRQAAYILHSMAHWQKTVHGHSGLRPALHERLYGQLRTFPDEASIAALADLHITYVVVHTDLYEEGQWQDVENRLEQFRDILQLEQVEGAGRVYALRPSLNAN